MPDNLPKTSLPGARRARGLRLRLGHMLAEIVRWHLRWGGGGLLLTAGLLVVAWLGPWPWSLVASVAAAMAVFASLAYVHIRAEAEVRDRTEEATRQVAARLAETEAAWTALRAEDQAALKHHLQQVRQDALGTEDRLRAAHADLAEELGNAQEALTARVAALEEATAADRTRWEQAMESAQQQGRRARDQAVEEYEKRFQQAKQEMAAQVGDLARELRAAIEDRREAVEKALRAERADRVRAQRLAELKPYQSHDRRLTEDDEETFLTVWATALDLPLTRLQLKYYQQRISSLEDQCRGRLAACVQDAILRVLLGIHVGQGRTFRVCEIGSLFGVNAVVLYDIVSCYCREMHMTLIDPLDGYYARGVTDPNTGLPVTRDLLESNLNGHGIPRDRWRLIQAYSTDPQAVATASDTRYDYLFIDGDHSYEGVCRDFELYAPLVTTGGLVVFDDYRREAWPGVARAVDDVVRNSPDFTLVGANWQSAVFRRRGRSHIQPPAQTDT